MKEELSWKLMTPRERTVYAIENNLEQHLHRVHELQSEIVLSKQFGVADMAKCLAQTKIELMGIAESFLWLRRYDVPEYTRLNYTSKDGLDTAELFTMEPYSQFEFEMDPDKPKEESFPLVKKNAACCGLRLHVKLIISEEVERELDFTFTRKAMFDMLDSFSNKH